MGQGDWMGKVQSSDESVGNAGAGALADSKSGLPSMPGTHGPRWQPDDWRRMEGELPRDISVAGVPMQYNTAKVLG